MTKTEAKKKLKEIGSLIEQALDLLSDLGYEVSDTIDEIEPYEGREELTEQQEERKEWFEGLQDEIDEIDYNLESATETIQGRIEE